MDGRKGSLDRGNSMCKGMARPGNSNEKGRAERGDREGYLSVEVG